MKAWASIVRRRGLRSAKFPSVSRLRFTCRLRVACEQACIGAFAFYLIGFGFAYDGDGDTNGFIGAGKSNFALSGRGYDDTEQHGSTRVPAPAPSPSLSLSPNPNANAYRTRNEPQPEPEP